MNIHLRQLFLCIAILFLLPFQSSAQIDESQLGAWYMYFWKVNVTEGGFGFQGDVQHRNFNLLGDLEQLLLRGGMTYTPAGSNAMFTLGYAHITTGTFGDSKDTRPESRIYQEALIPHTIGSRFMLTHRYRFEQRWVKGQDMRTRFRYNIFLNIPFNQDDLNEGAIYLALYNELFINGQRDIGGGNTVQIFDRNRAYLALGYSITDKLRTQLGYMEQTTNSASRGQLQVSLHQSF